MSLAIADQVDVWDRARIDLLKRTIARGTDDDEFEMFLAVCRRTGLDPFARQIYAIRRWDARERREVMGVQTSIDGLRLVAQRTGDYAGQSAPMWCGSDGTWTPAWLGHEPPRAARVGVYRRGFVEALTRVALWEESAQTNKQGELTGLWGRMPAHMLAIRAETHALRAAFPQELSGLYTADEMGDTSDDERPPVAAPPEPAAPETLKPDRVQSFLKFCQTEGVTAGEDIEACVRVATKGRTSNPAEVYTTEVIALGAAVTDMAETLKRAVPKDTPLIEDARRATAMRRLFAALGELGITDDDERHQLATEVLGREVTTYSDLTEPELEQIWQHCRQALEDRTAGADDAPM